MLCLLSETDRTVCQGKQLGTKSVMHYTAGAVDLLALNRVLRDYQQVALDWLVSLHKLNLPAVLMDKTMLGRKM